MPKRAIVAPIIAFWLAVSALPSIAAEDEARGWFDCFQASAPGNLPDVLVRDLLAHEGYGSSPQPSFRGRFSAILVPCAMQNGVSQEKLPQVTEYALRSLGEEGIRAHLLALGVSSEFLDGTVESFRREQEGEDIHAQLRADLDAEVGRAGLSPEIAAQLPILLVFYAQSSLALENAPPAN